MTPQRIIIVNPFGIGDVLFATPMISALRRAYPGVSLSFLANARTAPFLRHDPRLDKVLVYERDDFVAALRRSPWAFWGRWLQLVHELNTGRFDVAFDMSSGSPLGLALLLAGVSRRIGFDYKGRGRWLTERIFLEGYEDRHVAAYAGDLLGALDVEFRPSEDRLSFFLPEEDVQAVAEFLKARSWSRGGFVVIHPGGGASWGRGAALKRWPALNFAKLADKMIENRKCPVILMGDKSEVPLCEEVARQMTHPVVNVAGHWGLSRTAALMAQSNFVLANDGGPLHVAVAAGARTVSVFGPVDPVVYGPWPAAGHKAVVKGMPCQPCYRDFRMTDCTHRSCLATLSVNEVFTVLKEWL